LGSNNWEEMCTVSNNRPRCYYITVNILILSWSSYVSSAFYTNSGQLLTSVKMQTCPSLEITQGRIYRYGRRYCKVTA